MKNTHPTQTKTNAFNLRENVAVSSPKVARSQLAGQRCVGKTKFRAKIRLVSDKIEFLEFHTRLTQGVKHIRGLF
jgi:hypothetical protein